MDSENSKSSSSNLIILSPEDLAKLGLNLLVPNESRKNSKDAQSSASHSKKQKHAVRNNVKSSNSSSSAILQTQQSVDSHVNNLTEDIPENESILPKKRRGRPKKMSKDTCNKSSAEPPSTSKDYNVPKSKKIMPTKNVEEVRFKKPISNLIAKIVAKKLKDKSAVLDAQKSEDHRVHSEKETREFKKNSKNTCIIQPEQTVIDKSIPEDICERPNLHESGEQIGTDSDNSMAIRNGESNTTKAGTKQEHIEKQPRKHEPILENEIFKSQKESILSGEIANQLGIEKIKSPLIEVSPSPAKNINKGVIVLSNTAVSFTHEELKNLIAPMKMISSIQSIRNLDEDTTFETTVEANNSNQIPSSESIHEDDSCLFKQPDCGGKKITGNFNDDRKNTTNIIEHSEHIDISENMLSQKDMTKDTGDSLEPITEVVIHEGVLPNTSHENDCTPEEKKIRNNLKKKIEEYKMCSKSSISSKSFKDKNLRDPNLEIDSKSSTGMQQKLLDISTKEPKELIENRVTVLEESSSKNDHLFVEGAKNSRSNDNKKIRRSRIVCGPKIVGQSTHKSNKEEFSLNEQMNENQLVIENSSHNTMEVVSENKIKQCTIQKSHVIVSNEISGEIVQQNVKECGLQENAQGTMDQCGESSIMSSESVMTENQSLDLCLGNQSLQVQNSKQEELLFKSVGASIVASEQDEPMSPISPFKNREKGIRLETSNSSILFHPVNNINLTNMHTLEHDMKDSNSESQCLDDSSLNIGEHAIVSLDIGKIEEQSHEKSNFSNTKSQSDEINAGFQIDDSSKRQDSEKSSVVSINDLVESKSDDSLISTKSKMEMQKIIMPELGTRFDDDNKIDQIDEHLKRVPSDCINDEKHNSLSENQSDTINASQKSTDNFGSSDIFEETHSDREYKREIQKKSLPDLGTGFDDGLKAVQTNELSKQEDTDKTTVTDSTCNDEDQSNIMNVTVISTDNLDSLNTSTPMKGRGRKRKNSPSFNSQSNVETPISYQMEQSTSGRKREKVDYSEMVNLAEDNNINNEIEIENSIPGNLEGRHFNVKNVEESSVAVKKKRGRPKRIKIDLHTDATNDQSNEVNKFGNSENCNLDVEITDQEGINFNMEYTGESSNNQTESTGTLAPSKDLEECKTKMEYTTEEFSFSVKKREKQKKIKGDLFSDVNNDLSDEMNEPSELKKESAKSNSKLNYCEVVKKKKFECSVDIDKNQQGHEFDMEFAADCPKPNKKKIKKDILVCGTGLNTVQLSNQQDGSHKPTLALSKDWEECKSKIDITAEENSFRKMKKGDRSKRTEVEFDTGSDDVHSDNQIYEFSSNVIENYQCAKSSNILTDNIGAAEDLKESKYSGKKRGRKKKNDPSFTHQANAETPVTYQMEQSSSGGRRREVTSSYLEKDNIVEGNPTNVSMDQSDSMIKSEITPTSEKSSMSMNIEATGANDLMSVHDVATGEGESMESQNQCAKSLNISTDKFGVAQDLKEIKFSGKIPDCSNTPAPLKKRGRKMKNEPSFIDQANSETPKSYQMEQSTSGRRRRKVIHLENEDIAEAHSTNVPNEQSDSMIKSEITPTSEKSPISMNIKATGANDLISVHNVATGEGESMESQNQCAKSLNISTDNIGAAEDLKESKYSGKKRGRKKKSDPSFIHQANAETPITYQMEQSSSGRRRRKVDHLENENIVEANPPNVPIDQSDSMIKSEITPTSEEFSMSMDIKATGGNDSMYVQNAATGAAESMESQSQCAKSLNISTDNFGVAEDLKDIECSGEIPDCLNIPAPLKKRGRKKKSDLSFIHQANVETPISYQMEQSTSGRRRREVIYLENENKAQAHATSVQFDQSDSMIKSEITSTYETSSMSMNIKATGGNDSMYVHNAATGAAESMESQSQCTKSLNISTDNFGVAEDLKDIECSGEIPDCLNSPAPLKKRGRKKISDSSFIHQANSETPITYQMEQSSSGRRLREVNYLENENIVEANPTNVSIDQSDLMIKSAITSTSENSSMSMNIKATGANVASGEGELMESQSQCATSLNISTDNFGAAEDLKEIKYSGKISDSLNTPIPLKKRGRKKKSDLSFIHQANVETPITYQMEESSSGRRRREVDHSENENIVEANPSNVSIDQSDLMIKSEITPTSENSSMNIKATGAAESMEPQSQCAKSLNISTDNFGVAEDLKDIKCIEKSPDCLNTPAPLKKRGRKKKSDSSFIHQASFETPLTHQMEQSSSGRMRRKVNYLEIENMVKAKPPKVPIYQSNLIFKSEITSTSENSSMSMNITATSGNDLMSVCVAATGEADSMESQMQSAKSLNTDNFGATEDFKSGEILDCLNAPTPLNKRGRKKKSEPPFIHHANDLMSVCDAAAAEADSMALESTPSSVKKYTFHGKTTVMLNSIFSAAFKPSDIQESLETQQQSTPVLKAKGNRGPRRSNAPFMVMDGEGNVLCVICEQKIPIADWDSHNLSKHYNLSWCKGQDIVPIDDEKYVKKILKLHNKKEVRLTCYKCGQCSTSVHSYLVHFEECRGILVGGMVICAVCNIKMERDGWLLHKLRHNNLAWRIGDVPLDLNDKDFVMFVLNSLYKAKKPLYCDKCGQTKKSVIGYISHRSQCGVGTKEAHVECEICGKKMLPVSMLTHLKFVHGPKERKSDYFDVNIDTPLKKRKAAANALSMLEKLNGDGGTLPYFISQMDFKEHSFVASLLETELKEHGVLRCKYKNCEFIVGDIETLQDHMVSCRSKPNAYYTCTKCLAVLSKEENKEHLEKCHDITFSEDEYTTLELSDSEGENPKPKRKRVSAKTVLVNGVEKEIVFRKVPKCVMNCRQKSASSLLFPNAYEYSFNFYQKHYSDPNLFNDLRYSNNEWCLLKEDLIEKYLPKTTKSCRVAWKRVKSETCVLNEEPTFKEFELFEYMQDAHNTTIFCGGPISALAWMPTPFSVQQCEQILAVATLKDFEENYTRFKYRHDPSLVQFWNFGLLRNRAQVPEPKLHFCLAVDFGPVWEIEWCPSGCFDQSFSGDFGLARSGVLAVSGSVPSVHIYAVPVLPDDQRNLIYKVKPLLKLQMVLELEMMKRETYPSKMSWSKAQGHKLLAVGYTDGSVGIFDLATNSQLLKFKDEEGVDVLLPYRVIKAHKYSITALSMIHLSGGARWLFTGSFDKCANVWDLNDDSSCQTNVKRIITGGSWLTHWVAFITAYDESSSLNAFNNGIVNPHRNFLSDSMAMLRSQSTISSFSFNDWLNACLQSTSEGEICLYLPSQMLYCMDVAKLPSIRYCLNSTYLIDTTKSIEERIAHHLKKQDIAKYLTNTKGGVKKLEPLDIYESLMYKETTDKYGLLFCDLSRDNVQDFPRVRDKNFEVMKLSSPNMYPLQTVTKISFNPNCFSSLYFATGHQAGFVRLNYLKFLENDAQVKS